MYIILQNKTANIEDLKPITVVEIRIRNWLTVFFEDRIFYRLLVTVPLKMYRKFGQPKWILVGQMLKLVGKWHNVCVLLCMLHFVT